MSRETVCGRVSPLARYRCTLLAGHSGDHEQWHPAEPPNTMVGTWSELSKLTDVNLSILADTDCPSDWERDDLLEFAQEAAREILELRATLARERLEAKDQDR